MCERLVLTSSALLKLQTVKHKHRTGGQGHKSWQEPVARAGARRTLASWRKALLSRTAGPVSFLRAQHMGKVRRKGQRSTGIAWHRRGTDVIQSECKTTVIKSPALDSSQPEPPATLRGSNSGCQAWWQVLLPAKPFRPHPPFLIL